MSASEKEQRWAAHLLTKRNHRQARRSSFDAGWDAALAVFEKALTPTDDEREALVARLEDEVAYRVRTAVALHKGGHDIEAQVTEGRASVRKIASGFRRSEVSQGEPSDAQAERARIIADLREWSRPLGSSPEEETLRLVIDRIERAAGGAR